MIRAAFAALAFVAAPAAAQTHYQAQPEAVPAQARFVARDNIWRCAEGTCESDRSPARPAIVCSTLAREVGRLRSFSVQGQAFGEAQLAACNSRARQN